MIDKKQSIQLEQETILKAISVFPNGASREQIGSVYGFPYTNRTIQRRLERLKEAGKIIVVGEASGTRYHLAPNFIINAETETGVPHAENIGNDAERSVINIESSTNDTWAKYGIPLTEEAKGLLALISRPESTRKPVTYNRAFLEVYRPNFDFYLRPEELKKLAELSNTGASNQPAGTYARQIMQRLLIDLSWNSSRLEGNTYSLLDTARLLQEGQTAESKSIEDAQMILNHKDAIEFIVNNTEDIGVNRYTITNLHAMLAHNLLRNPKSLGSLRSFGVAIGKSVYTPLSIPQQIEDCFELVLSKAAAIDNPFEQAFFIMVHLPYLQPFEDVNKRVSRLAANLPLNRWNLVPLSFVEVPQELYTKGLLAIYELNRIELFRDVFLWSYERSSHRYAQIRQTLGEPDLFKMKYRELLHQVIREIVAGVMNKKAASIWMQQSAQAIPEVERFQFTESAETELLSLHDGSFARYKISPSQFRAWQQAWN